MKMKYEIIKGKTRHFFTIDELMKKTGCGESAIRHRMKQSHQWSVVMAKKGKHCIGGYTKKDKAKTKVKHAERKLNYQTEENKAEIKKRETKYANHPFWDQGKEGKLHRLLWGAW